jgi:hypothetical protein
MIEGLAPIITIDNISWHRREILRCREIVCAFSVEAAGRLGMMAQDVVNAAKKRYVRVIS